MNTMKDILYILLIIFSLTSCAEKREWTLASPDNQLQIVVVNESLNDKTSQLFYTVNYKGEKVILRSPLGIDREDEQFTENLSPDSKDILSTIDEKYTLKAGKKLEVRNHANELTLSFKNPNGKKVQLVLRAYNDGVAFRYNFPDQSNENHKVVNEKTAFALSTNGKAWIHPYDWNSRLKPSYEQYCESDIAIGAESPNEKGWAYPMLFNVDKNWIMITEAVLDGSYCATHIQNSPDGVYKVQFAEKEEVIIPDDPEPVSTLPWATPWRVIIVGDNLANIVETNIVQNLNPPSVISDESWIIPGRSSWSWWSEGWTAADYKTQLAYVDFTANMGWEYMLIDAGWQKMKEGSMEDVVKYANSKNVGVWLWYHSGAGRTNDTINHLNMLSFPEVRIKEFERIEKLGVKGIKIDFFDTDKQGIVKLYEEMLADAAKHHLMINFHGASLPRGLERTYPNLMTTEAIKGAESFGRQPACDRAPAHNATVPFTRNVIGSMDYTPVTFSNKIRQGVEAFNRTTYAHQLALSIVFESGVQNFADNYKSYEALPDAPKDFLKKVPVAWDETKFVAGYPGDYVILARRKGNVWYLGGINGQNEERSIEFELPFITEGKTLELLIDGTSREQFSEQTSPTGKKINVQMLPYGGFAGTIKN